MNQIQPHNEQGGLARVEPSIGNMLQLALENKYSPESIKSLVDAYVVMDNRARQQEFHTHFTRAQEEIPPVRKDAIRVLTKAGAKAPYATRKAIQKHLAEWLPKFGLSYKLRQSADKEGVHVTCIVSHVSGHSEEFPYTELWDNHGDSRTSKATTTAIRGALCLAFGLVIDDPEIRGGDDDDADVITPEQAEALRRGLAETGGSEQKLLQLHNVRSIEEIPAAAFTVTMNMIDSKRKATR